MHADAFLCVLMRWIHAENKYTLAFLAYGPENENTVFELTYNWGKDDGYSKGNAYAQVCPH